MYHYDALARIAQDRVEEMTQAAAQRNQRWENRAPAARRRRRWLR
jgi:hypothetical protein